MQVWYYKGQVVQELPPEVVGFVYRITNLLTGKMYVGRKYVQKRVKTKVKTKSKTAKSATKTRVRIKESDWKTYQGSCKPLLVDIQQFGVQHFMFEVMAWGYSKGQVNYLEENVQHKLDVLTDPRYYNDSIGSRKYLSVKLDETFRKVVSQINL
jgi:hypothetical protein